MVEVPADRFATPPTAVVAGHLCLDVIPRLPAGHRPPRAGRLDLVGPATLAVGGCVGNTGIALHRLGVRTTLVARIGDDAFGDVLAGLLHDAVPAERVHLRRTAGEATSYSVVFSRPGEDRAIDHYPGVNDTFVADDVPLDLLRSAALLHVGYPPLMAALAAGDGRELGRLLARARAAGCVTSLDMAAAHLEPGESRAGGRRLLEHVLPDVDVFLPSLGEASSLLGRRVRHDEDGAPGLTSVAGIADDLMALGARIVGVKLGDHGLYVRTASPERIGAVGRLSAQWADREFRSTVFAARVVGTVGAGDTTIAGFLFGLLAGWPPEAAVTAACAVGGSSIEGQDGTSAVPAWPTIERRIAGGWARRAASPAAGWTPSDDAGLWHGPRDRPPATR